MTVVATIQFTQDQTRTLTGVSVETIRHWRKVIPYLSAKTGKAARFSFSDLLGLAVTQELVNSFGVHIANVDKGIDALFRLLAESGPAALDEAIVSISLDSALLYQASHEYVLKQVLVKPTFTIPLSPLIANLQRHMLPVVPGSAQAALPFPPEVIWSRV